MGRLLLKDLAPDAHDNGVYQWLERRMRRLDAVERVLRQRAR
jgi:hypothetical protein